MKTNKLLIASAVLTWFSLGCAKFSASQVALQEANFGKFDKTESRPACEIQEAEYQLDTKMVGFEMNNSAGVRAGFNALTGFVNLLSVDFKAKSGSMELNMSLSSPIAPQYQLVDALGKGTFWSVGAGLDLGLNQVGGGFNFYHQTSLAKLAEKSLTDTFKNLDRELQPLQDEWSTQVVAIPTSEDVIIPVGSFAGIKKGDLFAIYNVDNVWQGEPCQSKFLMARKNPAEPVAYGEVTDIVKNAAALRLLNDDAHPRRFDARILKGAKVEVFKLTDNKRTLYRNLQIRSVIGAELNYIDGSKVDIGPKIRDQIDAIARRFGFMMYAP